MTPCPWKKNLLLEANEARVARYFRAIIAKTGNLASLDFCCSKMRLCKYNIINKGRRGQKPGYIHEMGSHDLKSCEVKCQRNNF
jgi:hypothetical protein